MLINLRNALMAGKRLPYDAEVEYLESTGTQYINTGVILDSTYGIDILFAPMESASGVSEHGIFGSSVSGSGTIHNVLQIHSSAGGVGLWMPSNTRICNYAITVGGYQHWQINLGNTNNVVVDGTNRGLTHPTTASACPYSVYLFARNVGGSLKSGSCSKMRLASWKVYDGNGNLVQDCIAVRKSGVGYLYDRVSGKLFGNAGTGDFVLGQDVVPVEYIESHGTEYINLDYLQASKLRVKFEASIASSYTGGEMDLLSNQYTAQVVGRFAIGVYQSRFFAYSRYEDNDGNATSDIVSPDTMYSVDCTFDTLHDTKTLSVDGIDFTANKCTNISNRGNGVRLFSAANIVTSTWKGRIKFLKMWKDDVPWYNHIPVRVGTEGAMMDVLTRRIYRNAGTGAFTYGNDLKYPIPA